jgi:hypothetical protein
MRGTKFGYEGMIDKQNFVGSLNDELLGTSKVGNGGNGAF